MGLAANRCGMLGGMGLPAGDRELVQIMATALADAARRAGEWLVCRAGCTPCCHGAFAINALDAARLKTGIDALKASDPELAETIEHRARMWIQAHGAAFPGNLATGQLGQSDEDRERFEGFANDAACPALNGATGHCDVYAWRPMTCRVFGPPVRVDAGEQQALGHCELCFHGASEAEIAACEMPVPHKLEAELVENLEREGGDGAGETVVAFALLR
ncbi:MAG TPA: YkgJ family cysteine cluster protein [Terracidiphilus sp.]|jgi:Fe-S-cluster containining protein